MVLADTAHSAAIAHLSKGSRRVKLLWVGGEFRLSKSLNLLGGETLDSISVCFYHIEVIIIATFIIFLLRAKSSNLHFT